MNYQVQNGDSPALIARRYGVPFAALIRANPRKITTQVAGVRTWVALVPGEVITIPVPGMIGQAPAASGTDASGSPCSQNGEDGSTACCAGLTLDAATGTCVPDPSAPPIPVPVVSTELDNLSKRNLPAEAWKQAAVELAKAHAWGQAAAAKATANASPAAAALALSNPCLPESAQLVGDFQKSIGQIPDGKYGSGVARALKAQVPAAPLACDAGGQRPAWWAPKGQSNYGQAAVPAVPGVPPTPPVVIVTPPPIPGPPPASNDLTNAAKAALAELNADSNYCQNVRHSGSLNTAVHAFKQAWNNANPGSKVPIGTGNYEPAVAAALSNVSGVTAPSGCPGLPPLPPPPPPPPAPIKKDEGPSTGAIVAGSIGIVALVGVVALAASSKKPSVRYKTRKAPKKRGKR